jgi:hypothetical protein
MKKLTLTITFLTVTLVTFAQGPQLGVQASPILSVMSYDGDALNGIGFTVGLSGNFPLGEHWSIRPEFNIQQRVGTMNSTEEITSRSYSYSETGDFTLKYLMVDIPVLIEYRTKSNLGFYFGPQFGASVGSKAEWKYKSTEKNLNTGEEETYEGTESEDMFDGNINEFSFAAGTNYNLNNGLSFEFRVQQSVGVLYTYDGDFDTGLSFATIQLGCRYTIPNFKKS